MTGQTLNEIQAAAYAGFSRWAHFLIARNRDLFPKPAKEMPGTGPVWTRQQIDLWLGLAEAPRSKTALEIEEEAILDEMRKKAALRREQGGRLKDPVPPP